MTGCFAPNCRWKPRRHSPPPGGAWPGPWTTSLPPRAPFRRSFPAPPQVPASPGLHQALHPLPARNEWGEDRGEGKPIKTHLLSPALSSIGWRRGLEFGFSFSFDAEKDGGFERVIAFYAVLVAVDFS